MGEGNSGPSGLVSRRFSQHWKHQRSHHPKALNNLCQRIEMWRALQLPLDPGRPSLGKPAGATRHLEGRHKGAPMEGGCRRLGPPEDRGGGETLTSPTPSDTSRVRRRFKKSDQNRSPPGDARPCRDDAPSSASRGGGRRKRRANASAPPEMGFRVGHAEPHGMLLLPSLSVGHPLSKSFSKAWVDARNLC